MTTNFEVRGLFQEERFTFSILAFYWAMEPPIVAIMTRIVFLYDPLFPFTGVSLKGPPFKRLENFGINEGKNFRRHHAPIIITPTRYLFI